MAPSPDVFLVSIGPPDGEGFSPLYNGTWWSAPLARGARTVIGEVREDAIRTGGDSSIHISDIDCLVRSTDAPPSPPIPPRTEEEAGMADVICSPIAAELVKDRDCLQVGIRTYSSAVLAFLDDKHDLGLHSEIVLGGAADLVRRGIITGKYKQVHPRKVTFAAIVQLSPRSCATSTAIPPLRATTSVTSTTYGSPCRTTTSCPSTTGLSATSRAR